MSGRSTDDESNQLAQIFAIAAQVNKLARASAEHQLAAASLAADGLLVDDDPERELPLVRREGKRLDSNADGIAVVRAMPDSTERARPIPTFDGASADGALLCSADFRHQHPRGREGRIV